MRFLTLLALLLTSLVAHAEGVQVKPPSKSLIIYDRPAKDATIIPTGESLAYGKERQGDWRRILYIEGSKAKYGWVKADSIEPLQPQRFKGVISDTHPVAPAAHTCNFYDANPLIKVRFDDFTCDKNIVGPGFSRCTTSLLYTVVMTCSLNGSVRVAC